uniref:Uncharacterized protein n=1 Tax=Oryza sativa subsp. japonica TaxID=39947 RepID=Q6YTM7_ORYSJ|nr:hypothetical protein [Oryza sativa Japonica Group]
MRRRLRPPPPPPVPPFAVAVGRVPSPLAMAGRPALMPSRARRPPLPPPPDRLRADLGRRSRGPAVDHPRDPGPHWTAPLEPLPSGARVPAPFPLSREPPTGGTRLSAPPPP